MSAGLVQRKVKLDQAVFAVSIDTELAWGSFDRDGLNRYGHLYSQERIVIAKLLDLFERYQIKATWAIVGHLFLEHCSQDGPDNHKHVLQPKYSWYPHDWLSHDPYSDVESEPFFYGPDIVSKIISSSQPKEIASHTFTHAILGDAECSREVSLSQLKECVRLAEQLGVNLQSVVFPRNSVGRLDVLCELGFLCFRGVERNWYQKNHFSSGVRKLSHFMDRFLALSPPVYSELDCYRCLPDFGWLVDVPASMFYVPFDGAWRLVPVSRRVRQALKGLHSSINRKALFHLWFHPSNLATSPLLLEGLEEILFHVNDKIKQGDLSSLTMSETASRVLSVL